MKWTHSVPGLSARKSLGGSREPNILFQLVEASLGKPEGMVRDVVYPAAPGGKQTLRELVHEFKTRGPVYRRTVQTMLKAPYCACASSVRPGVREHPDAPGHHAPQATGPEASEVAAHAGDRLSGADGADTAHVVDSPVPGGARLEPWLPDHF
ncbi:hypothetical protein ABT115_18230 [Streptomyces sp. NPDC001832]|uniref:hypothetical protein n=1 Tax=Streptomyces sp. NPDC001832 TaxID=3154527 RepID=UPI003326E993